MTLTELRRLVAKGESDRLEFKKSTGQRTEAAKTICGMLNGVGGCVIFGATMNISVRPTCFRRWLRASSNAPSPTNRGAASRSTASPRKGVQYCKG